MSKNLTVSYSFRFDMQNANACFSYAFLRATAWSLFFKTFFLSENFTHVSRLNLIAI